MKPVVVIGNGPVGQTAALLLARWGLPTVVLDERHARDLVGSKSICQHRDVLDIWDSVGAGARIAAEGVTWTTSRTFHRGTELFNHTFVDAGSSPFPPFVNISQSRTEEILDEHIAAQLLIDVRWGKRVVGLRQDADGVTVTCEDGTEAEASFVVVCAGARSDELRALLGVRFEGHSFDDRFLICDIRTELPEQATERHFHFDPEWNPGRQVLMHPSPDSTFRIDWQVPPDFDLDDEMRSGALDRRITAVIGDRPYEILWQSVYRFHARCVDRMRVGRVLLAGDAAHLVAPFGARGLNSGVPDAENAAWKIAFVARGWAPPELLESYHDERHAAARENLAVTSATMDFLVPQTAEQAAYRRNVLERARHDPAARALVNSGRLVEPFWYTDSPLTTRSPSRPVGGRPPSGALQDPGPGILAPDAPWDVSLRFRVLAREGFLLLLTPGADVSAARTAAERICAPVRVVELVDGDPTGVLAGALAVRPGEVWVVRPDAYVAAVLEQPTSVTIETALRRALAGATDREESEHGVLPTVR
ncbi:FAD-dependent monooxygenase [Pseudonocardia xinjiangensis]|uniref:FAD-dependent monooxygenase n=1 Tax=Pseudonocardia xinjiangensis TaxID=75289 RepID=UPI003D9294AE